MELIGFERFSEQLLVELELQTDTDPNRDTDLVADLGFDSLMYAAALGVLGGLGAAVDDQAIAQASTLGDLYHLYAAGMVESGLSAMEAP